MKILKSLVILLLSLNAISQTDHIQNLLGVGFGKVSYMTNEITTPSTLDHSAGPMENNSYGTVTKKYECLTGTIQVGGSAPFLKVKRMSFGIQPQFGLGFLKSKGHIDKTNLNAEIDNPVIRSFVAEATGLLYFRCKIWENWHISLLGGYRLVASYMNYSTPVYGLEFGQDRWRINFYSYNTTISYYRELSNGERTPIKEFKDFWSVGVFYCIGKKPIK